MTFSREPRAGLSAQHRPSPASTDQLPDFAIVLLLASKLVDVIAELW